MCVRVRAGVRACVLWWVRAWVLRAIAWVRGCVHACVRARVRGCVGACGCMGVCALFIECARMCVRACVRGRTWARVVRVVYMCACVPPVRGRASARVCLEIRTDVHIVVLILLGIRLRMVICLHCWSTRVSMQPHCTSRRSAVRAAVSATFFIHHADRRDEDTDSCCGERICRRQGATGDELTD